MNQKTQSTSQKYYQPINQKQRNFFQHINQPQIFSTGFKKNEQQINQINERKIQPVSLNKLQPTNLRTSQIIKEKIQEPKILRSQTPIKITSVKAHSYSVSSSKTTNNQTTQFKKQFINMFSIEGNNVINEMKRFQKEMLNCNKHVIDPNKLILDYENKLINRLFMQIQDGLQVMLTSFPVLLQQDKDTLNYSRHKLKSNYSLSIQPLMTQSLRIITHFTQFAQKLKKEKYFKNKEQSQFIQKFIQHLTQMVELLKPFREKLKDKLKYDEQQTKQSQKNLQKNKPKLIRQKIKNKDKFRNKSPIKAVQEIHQIIVTSINLIQENQQRYSYKNCKKIQQNINKMRCQSKNMLQSKELSCNFNKYYIFMKNQIKDLLYSINCQIKPYECQFFNQLKQSIYEIQQGLKIILMQSKTQQPIDNFNQMPQQFDNIMNWLQYTLQKSYLRSEQLKQIQILKFNNQFIKNQIQFLVQTVKNQSKQLKQSKKQKSITNSIEKNNQIETQKHVKTLIIKDQKMLIQLQSLKNKINSIQKQKQCLANENKKLNHIIHEYSKKNQQSIANYKLYQSGFKIKEIDLKNSYQKMNSLSDQLMKHKHNIQMKDKQIEHQKQINKQIQNHLITLEKVQSQKIKLDIKFQKLQNENKTLLNQLQETEIRNISIELENKSHKNQNQVLMNQIKKYQETILSLKNEIQSNKTKYEQKQLNGQKIMSQKINSLVQMFKQFENQKNNQSIKSLIQENQKLKLQCKNKQDQFKNQLIYCQKLKKTLQNTQNNHKNHKNKQNFDKNRMDLKEKLQASNQQLQCLRKVNEQILQENKKIKRQLESKITQVQNLLQIHRSDAFNQQKQQLSLKEKVDHLQQEIKASQKIIEDLKKQIERLKQSYKDEIRKIQDQVSQRSFQTNKRFKEEKQKLELKLSQQKNQIEDLQDKLDVAQAKISRLDKKLKQVQK